MSTFSKLEIAAAPGTANTFFRGGYSSPISRQLHSEGYSSSESSFKGTCMCAFLTLRTQLNETSHEKYRWSIQTLRTPFLVVLKFYRARTSKSWLLSLTTFRLLLSSTWTRLCFPSLTLTIFLTSIATAAWLVQATNMYIHTHSVWCTRVHMYIYWCICTKVFVNIQRVYFLHDR